LTSLIPDPKPLSGEPIIGSRWLCGLWQKNSKTKVVEHSRFSENQKFWSVKTWTKCISGAVAKNLKQRF